MSQLYQCVTKSLLQKICRRLGFDSWVRKIPLEKEMATHSVFLPGGSQGQRSLAGYSPLGHNMTVKAVLYDPREQL